MEEVTYYVVMVDGKPVYVGKSLDDARTIGDELYDPYRTEYHIEEVKQTS